MQSIQQWEFLGVHRHRWSSTIEAGLCQNSWSSRELLHCLLDNHIRRPWKWLFCSLSIYVAIHDARCLIHVCCFSSLMLCLCCMLRESYTSRCDTITICMQQQRSCMLVLRAAQHKHKEREGLEYNRRAVFENRRESLHIWSQGSTLVQA